MSIGRKNDCQSDCGQMPFQLYRSSSECFRLRWKRFGMVSMKRAHLIALRRQLIAVCERMIRSDAPSVEEDIQLRCNGGGVSPSGSAALRPWPCSRALEHL
jgi:hypothetical protein